MSGRKNGLEAQLHELEGKKDSVETGDLSNGQGKETARAARRQLTAQVETLAKRIRGMFVRENGLSRCLPALR